MRMRMIFCFFIALFVQFVGYMVKAVSAVFNPENYKPVLKAIGNVGSQVLGIKYTFDKKPCSATGGIA